MYSLYGKIKYDYYLKVRHVRVRLISCLPDSNRNLAGEFIQVNGNWLADELPCPLLPHDVGRFYVPLSVSILTLLPILLMYVLTGLFFYLL